MSLLAAVWRPLVTALTIASAAAAAAAANPQSNWTTVHTASGRAFTGWIDPRSDSDTLWLRWERSGVIIIRPIAWHAVTGADVAGNLVSGAELRQLVASLADAARRAKPPLSQSSDRVLPDSRAARPVVASHAANRLPEVEPNVTSLAVSATLGNWDADAMPDGLLIAIWPVDALGFALPVRGTLVVELVAERRGGVVSDQPFQRVSRWTRRVEIEDFVQGAAVYQLPFQGFDPADRDDYATHAAVHARLLIPGHGAVEATDAMVRIVPASPLRDRLEQATGKRWLPQER